MNLVTLVPVLYILFTSRADWLAYSTGFIRRARAFDGRTFLQTLVFGWLRRPRASLEHLAGDLGISRQALDQRFTPAAVAFCVRSGQEVGQNIGQVEVRPTEVDVGQNVGRRVFVLPS